MMLEDDIPLLYTPLLPPKAACVPPPIDHDPIQLYIDQPSHIDIPDLDWHLSLPQDHGFAEQHSHTGDNTPQQSGTGRKKSVFHNFQKHLITFVKKTLLVDLYDDTQHWLPPLCKRIITAFRQTSSFNKKTLHMLVGVGSGAVDVQVTQQLFPRFQQATEGATPQEVMEAQGRLRQLVVQYAGGYSREWMGEKCSMNRFEAFYEYYLSFVGEVEAGPLSRRLSKPRKCNALRRIEEAQLSPL